MSSAKKYKTSEIRKRNILKSESYTSKKGKNGSRKSKIQNKHRVRDTSDNVSEISDSSEDEFIDIATLKDDETFWSHTQLPSSRTSLSSTKRRRSNTSKKSAKRNHSISSSSAKSDSIRLPLTLPPDNKYTFKHRKAEVDLKRKNSYDNDGSSSSRTTMGNRNKVSSGTSLFDHNAQPLEEDEMTYVSNLSNKLGVTKRNTSRSDDDTESSSRTTLGERNKDSYIVSEYDKLGGEAQPLEEDEITNFHMFMNGRNSSKIREVEGDHDASHNDAQSISRTTLGESTKKSNSVSSKRPRLYQCRTCSFSSKHNQWHCPHCFKY